MTDLMGIEPWVAPDEKGGIYFTPLYHAIRDLAQMAPYTVAGAELDGREFRKIIDFVLARLPRDLVSDRPSIRDAVLAAGAHECLGLPEEQIDDDLALRCFVRDSLLLALCDDEEARLNLPHEDAAVVRQCLAHILVHKSKPN
jgi:hypothetical protein